MAPQQVQVIPKDKHPLVRQDINSSALRITDRLGRAGFDAYLVGGCVRDLLLRTKPKDFDIATNARPEQIRTLFRGHSMIIGRRFPIVHVRYEREVIEVSTFRAQPATSEQGAAKRSVTKDHRQQSFVTSAQGMILRDNCYGLMSDDALRRDFTVNALYFEPKKCTLHDFTGAMADLAAGRLRLIGEPKQRYAEDPVRMLRAARFVAKLGFATEAATGDLISELAPMLEMVPTARLFGEVCKLFLSGHASASLTALQDFNLLSYLFAQSTASTNKQDWALVRHVLKNIDRHLEGGGHVSPRLLYAGLLWPAYQDRLRQVPTSTKGNQAARAAAQAVASPTENRTALTKRMAQSVRDILIIQAQLEDAVKLKQIERFAEEKNQTFRLACHFLQLRAEAEQNSSLRSCAKQWQQKYPRSVRPARKRLDSRHLSSAEGKKPSMLPQGKKRKTGKNPPTAPTA